MVLILAYLNYQTPVHLMCSFQSIERINLTAATGGAAARERFCVSVHRLAVPACTSFRLIAIRDKSSWRKNNRNNKSIQFLHRFPFAHTQTHVMGAPSKVYRCTIILGSSSAVLHCPKCFPSSSRDCKVRPVLINKIFYYIAILLCTQSISGRDVDPPTCHFIASSLDKQSG